MCRTELITNKETRSLFTGEYAGKSIERGRQGALIKVILQNVTNETGLIASQISINETREFMSLNLMPGDCIKFKATLETVYCNCFEAHSGVLLSSLKSIRLMRPTALLKTVRIR